MTKLRVTSQKTILQTDFITVQEEHIEIGDHKEVHHNIYRLPAVMVVPITDSYEVYLISQYRYLYSKRCLEAVAGYIEKGESTLEAAKRELKEEVGMVASQWEEVFRTELAGSIFKSTIHIFLARGLEQKEHNREIGEDIEVIKMPLHEAAQKVTRGEIHDASSAIGILLLDTLRKEKKI